MLEIANVHVSYGPIKAVRDVSLTVKEGEIAALLGPNGAGKTSLISAAVGLTPVASGGISFQGRDITHSPTEAVVKSGMTLTPEGRRVFGDHTVAENLRLGAACRKDKDGVAADLLQALQPPGEEPVGHGDADAGVVLMHVDALQLEALAVEKETALGVR
ncbi:MAG: ATP-binding cassette domain-containing protein, partial [Sphingomonadales bacterium]|nr:ATP-binding cassette domain-containing protein [Sphingomonadales bacterium]